MECPSCGKIFEITEKRVFRCPDCGLDFRELILPNKIKIKRFLSFLLDLFIIFLPIISYRFSIYFLEKASDFFYIVENKNYCCDVFSYTKGLGYFRGYLTYGRDFTELFFYPGIIAIFLFFFILLMQIYMVVVKKSSLGKSIWNIKVSYLSLSLPSKLDMFLRGILGVVLCAISFFFILFTKYSQGVEDKVFSTILVDENKVKKIYGGFFDE